MKYYQNTRHTAGVLLYPSSRATIRTMKLELIDFTSTTRETLFGTCELCYHSGHYDETEYTFRDDSGNTFTIDGYAWDWGDLTTVDIINIPAFAAWITTREFDDDFVLDFSSFRELADTHWEFYSRSSDPDKYIAGTHEYLDQLDGEEEFTRAAYNTARKVVTLMNGAAEWISPDCNNIAVSSYADTTVDVHQDGTVTVWDADKALHENITLDELYKHVSDVPDLSL